MDDLLYCCVIRDESRNPDLLTEFISAWECDYSSWENRDERITYHTIYTDSAAAAEGMKGRVEEQVAFWKECGIFVTDISCQSIRREDWAEVWKKHFTVMEVSPRVVVRPSWLGYSPKPDQVVLEIDPGMSFGTGQHATTSFCLQMLDRLADDQPGSFLDAGCGSGILSIAAQKLGYAPVTGFDIDPDAIRVAEENLEINSVSAEDVSLCVSDLAAFVPNPAGYEVVAANILSHVLVANRKLIVSMVKPAGHLMLAGILSTEFDSIAEKFCAEGLRLEFQQSEKEWTSGLFIKE